MSIPMGGLGGGPASVTPFSIPQAQSTFSSSTDGPAAAPSSSYRMSGSEGKAEDSRVQRGDLTGENCLCVLLDNNNKNDVKSSSVISSIWVEETSKCVLYEKKRAAASASTATMTKELLLELKDELSMRSPSGDEGEKSNKVKQTVTFVLPTSGTQSDIKAAQKLAADAGCVLKHVFSRSIAEVAGLLALDLEVSSRTGDSPSAPLAKRLLMADNDDDHLCLHIRKEADGLLSGAVVVCEGSRVAKERGNLLGLSHLANRKVVRGAVGATSAEVLDALQEYCAASCSSVAANCVVVSGDVDESSFSEQQKSSLSFYVVSDRDAVRGGCVLSAAELESSKHYINYERYGWVLAYQLPVATPDSFLAEEVGLFVFTADSETEEVDKAEPLFVTEKRLWNQEQGAVQLEKILMDDDERVEGAYATPQISMFVHNSNYSDVEESESGDDDEISSPSPRDSERDIPNAFGNDVIDNGQPDENKGLMSSPPFLDRSSRTSSRSDDDCAGNNATSANLSPQTPVAVILPAGWEEFQSDEGWTYYFHAESQVSTWDRPSTTHSTSGHGAPVPSILLPSNPPYLNESHDETSSGRHSLGGNSGSLVTSMNARGQSALHISAAQNMVEGLSILLQSEVNADIIDANGRTSLQLVCMNPPESRQLECMKILIDYGADINTLDKQTGNSLLHFCVLTGNAPGLEVLLAAGADSNKTNFTGDTPLHLAAKSAQFECMQKLVLLVSGSTISGSAEIAFFKAEASKSAPNNYTGNHRVAQNTRSHETAWDMYETAKRNGFNSSHPPQSYAELAQQRNQRLSRNRGRDSKHRQSASDDVSVSSKGSGSINASASANGPGGKAENEQPESEWVQLYTPAGDVYFYNASEQRVQWENPYAASASLDAGMYFEDDAEGTGGLTSGFAEDLYGNLYESSSQRSGQSSLRERLKQRKPADGNVGSSSHPVASGMNTTLHDTRPQETTIRQSGGMRTTLKQPISASERTPSKGYDRYEAPPAVSPPKPSPMDKVNTTLFMTPPSKRGKGRGLPGTNGSRLEAQAETVQGNKSLTRSISDDTLSDLSDQSQSALSTKERHIKVWTRFFENAMNAKAGGKAPSAHVDDESREKSVHLIAAVMQNDSSYVERLLLGGGDANFVDEHMRSSAHYASKTGNVSLLALLYEYGADLELRDGNGQTPLHIASIVGVSDSVTFLLESAVVVDSKDKFGYTPLHLAAISGHLDVCTILLEYGAALDSKNNYGVNIATSVQNVVPKSEAVQRVADYLDNALNAKSSQKEVPKKSGASQATGQQNITKAEKVSGNSSTTSTPWTSLTINTNVAGTDASSSYSSHYDRPPQPLEGTDGDDYEEENDYEDDNRSGIVDSVSGAVWGVASTLLGAATSMFKKSEKNSSKSSGKYGNSYGAGSALSLAAKNQHTWDSHAPPTDSELYSRGLGPPPFVVDQLQAGVESIRTGATPRRNVSAPVEVKLAVDWYRRNSSPNVTPKHSDISSSDIHHTANPINKPVPLFDFAAAQAKQAAGSGAPNQYSLSTVQRKGPSGYPQYVDVFADSSALNK